MDFFNQFLDNIKQTVIEAIKDVLQEIKQEACEEWVNTKDIARHLGQSEEWVRKHLYEIPHIKQSGGTGAVRYKKSHVDKWRIEKYGMHYDETKDKPRVHQSSTKKSSKAWTPIS